MVIHGSGENTFNLFDLLLEVQEELSLTNKLASLGLSRAAGRLLGEAAINVGASRQTDPHLAQVGNIVRIDVSKGAKSVVHFLNNIEKDEQYSAWPRSLKQLLFPSWSLTTVRRNMYTLIANVDILSFQVRLPYQH